MNQAHKSVAAVAAAAAAAQDGRVGTTPRHVSSTNQQTPTRCNRHLQVEAVDVQPVSISERRFARRHQSDPYNPGEGRGRRHSTAVSHGAHAPQLATAVGKKQKNGGDEITPPEYTRRRYVRFCGATVGREIGYDRAAFSALRQSTTITENKITPQSPGAFTFKGLALEPPLTGENEDKRTLAGMRLNYQLSLYV